MAATIEDIMATTPLEEIKHTCAICGKPINLKDYPGERLTREHTVDLTVMAGIGECSLPYMLEVHGDCLPELRDKIIEKNKGWKWI
jgi:hypothetical protein